MQVYLEEARKLVKDDSYLVPSFLCYEALVAFEIGDGASALRKQEASKSLDQDWNDVKETYLQAYRTQADHLKKGRAEVILPLTRDSRIGPLGM